MKNIVPTSIAVREDSSARDTLRHESGADCHEVVPLRGVGDIRRQPSTELRAALREKQHHDDRADQSRDRQSRAQLEHKRGLFIIRCYQRFVNIYIDTHFFELQKNIYKM